MASKVEPKLPLGPSDKDSPNSGSNSKTGEKGKQNKSAHVANGMGNSNLFGNFSQNNGKDEDRNELGSKTEIEENIDGNVIHKTIITTIAAIKEQINNVYSKDAERRKANHKSSD